MNKIYQIKELNSTFKAHKTFTTKDVVEFYQKENVNIKRQTVIRRISVLIKQGILKRVGKGLYRLGQEKKYFPIFDKKNIKLYSKLNKQFPLLDFCIWDTSAINEFMLHQPSRYYTIIETERDATEAVFNFLKEFNKNVYLNPDEKTVDLYISNNHQSIIVRTLITEAPVQIIDNIPTITIEKLLADIFIDENLFTAQQGAEMKTIFIEAFRKYTINKNKLLRYSNRRKKKQNIELFISKILKND